MTEDFDFERALADLRAGGDLTGKDGILTPLIKQLTEAALKAEMAAHLETDNTPNRKNGYGRQNDGQGGTKCSLSHHPTPKELTQLASAETFSTASALSGSRSIWA